MIRRALSRLGILRAPPSATGTIPRTVIHVDGDPYLTRYYLIRTEHFRVYLHKIHRSDQDRALHDHPWGFCSVLLWGLGYWEDVPGARRYFPPFSLNWRPNPAAPHRVELPQSDKTGQEIPQWSLVLVGRRVRRWSFYVPLRYCPRAWETRPLYRESGEDFRVVPSDEFMRYRFSQGRYRPRADGRECLT